MRFLRSFLRSTDEPTPVVVVAPRAPQPGDGFWHHGRGFRIKSVDERGHVITTKTDGYHVETNVSQMAWNRQIGRWVLPGTEGPMPLMVRGVERIPEPPACPECGFRTIRPVPCHLCRDQAAANLALQTGALTHQQHKDITAGITAQRVRRDDRLEAIRRHEAKPGAPAIALKRELRSIGG